MRRGHPGIGGWRNENHRHFRPRNDGSPRFRPPRMYSLLDGPRFPPPGPRLHRGPHPYNVHSLNSDELSDHQERNKYRNHSHHQSNLRIPDRGHHHRPKHSYPYNHPKLKSDDNTQYTHSLNPYYKEVPAENYHINSLGDVDQRQLGNAPQTHRINPWVNPPHDQRHFFEERSIYKFSRHHESEGQATEGNKIPSLDYTGHRPPSSDYYGSTSGAALNNNDTSFSRSVDDTVDIVRKRLMNRSGPQYVAEDSSAKQNSEGDEVGETSHQLTQQEPPAKRRIQKQRQNIKSNCDKMKSNIVHQLFKMDKDKMHKLMDDPGSSSKFEYAISSLITESQNSLNRHLRSVAEKSLVSSSSDFIHNDNNTIYEDTFMKQMQCILDPQDTVLLEDIKPLVLAELSKVLQLNDSDLRYDTDYQNMHQPVNEDLSYPIYENYNYEDYSQENLRDEDLRVLPNYDDYTRDIGSFDYGQNNQTIKKEQDHQEPVFETLKPPLKSEYDQDRRHSTDSQRKRRSIDTTHEEQFCANNESLPLFDTNTEQFSEDEDTFAELDKQYHVPVDHNFLDDISARTTPTYVHATEETNPINIKKEISNPLQLAISPITAQSTNTAIIEKPIVTAHSNQEVLQSPDFPKENSTPANSHNISHKIEYIDTKRDHAPGCKVTDNEVPRNDNLIKGKSSQSNGRKRSIDQRPSHRKEKRKKSESFSTELPYYKHDTSRDRYNDDRKSHRITTSSESSKKITKNNRSSGGSEKKYSDKYVKRKESSTKKHEVRRKRNSSSSSQTILSPKDSSNNSSLTPTKTDSKIKFKTIDMFMEQTKKVPVHAIRNTASLTATPKAVEDNRSKQATTPVNTSCKLVSTKHASTQVFKRAINKETQTFESKNSSTRHCQTEKLRMLSKGNQTSNELLDKPKPKAKDAFERMKEIDMEIQNLLQEKFKLYHSLESRDSSSISENLGMTVLNVTPIADHEKESIIEEDASKNKNLDAENDPSDSMSADAIANDFTNIPVEELEQIALESIEDVNVEVTKAKQPSLRQRNVLKDRMSSASPSSTSSKRRNKKEKTPNISLIEQIITDDRPLEEIISLDDLEASPKQKKKSKNKPKKKVSKKSKSVKNDNQNPYNLKECSVILVQTDISQFTKPIAMQEQSTHIDNNLNLEASETVNVPIVIDNVTLDDFEIPLGTNYTDSGDILQNSVVDNDLQFDMLDVSEDIVIGESCEIKDKDSSENAITISEDLILDNSQSSVDDVLSAETALVENECKTYDYSTDEELRRDSLTVTGNADAVLAIECIENGFLAACLDGNVYHFSTDGQLLNTMRGSNLAVTCLTIVKEKYGTTVYTGSLDSRIRYYELETGLEKGPECNVLSPIQTMDRAWDTVFVGTRTGFVLQFECKNNMLIPVSTVKFSEQAILALRAMKEGPRKVLLVASRSENVTVKDAQTGLLLRTLSGPKMTVYTLLFEDGKVYCGTSSHQIHVFDYASGTHTNSHEGGKGAVCLRATGGLLFAGCYDGCVYIYREGETKPLAQLRGPSLMLLSLAVVGSKIIAGYKDRSLYIWKIPLSILQEMIL